MFHMPMSSPMMTRMLGLSAACATPTVNASETPATNNAELAFAPSARILFRDWAITFPFPDEPLADTSLSERANGRPLRIAHTSIADALLSRRQRDVEALLLQLLAQPLE